MVEKNAQLLLAAAGRGARLGRDEPKALIPLAGVPMVARALACFENLPQVGGAIVTAPPGCVESFEAALKGRQALPLRIIEGGAERQESVRIALDAMDKYEGVVVIHDAARPFVTAEIISACITEALEHGAATVAVPCVDTILQGRGDGFLERTPDRSRLWACQTPQAFRFDLIRSAHENAARQGLRATDDATLVRRMGFEVKLVVGSPENRKITTPEDLAYAEHLFANGRAPETERP